ncbi:predicted P-loop ATPase fused to an acetyltransferase [Vibrio maritimus]|uniref:tRNA(Met) cytidine acetyltransferase TmcA n=1 Tax=Vibrio maritimus TaxID=990268 RepID=A0A090T9X4_9VIBR|nr:predicted P-loop ATPase fused to an acetyltransferase [Vibrio maritimus]
MANHSLSSRIDSQLSSITQLQQLAQTQCVRAVTVLKGESQWQQTLLALVVDHFPQQSRFHIGSEKIDGLVNVPSNQGKRLLGQDTQMLVVTIDEQFDANSFNAALGTLVGGGLLILLHTEKSSLHPWLVGAISELPMLEESSLEVAQPSCFCLDDETRLASLTSNSAANRFEQQEQAIELIHHVVTGHRKRPLVLTADRGRGKTSALGIAAARFNGQRPLRVLITAPSKSAVVSALAHFNSELEGQSLSASSVTLEFVAPDELLQTKPNCDLLFVDEAAALPISMLKQMVEHYHRMVISTTIHGYEGCGRGFSVKFLPWLTENRKDAKSYHLDSPIRWSQYDLLEPWASSTFLLNAELSSLPEPMVKESIRRDALTWESFDAESASLDRERLDAAFALLVNAHYQTSPNDLMWLLNSKTMKLYIMSYDDIVVGSILVNREGQLDRDLIERVQLGRARPAGHLVPMELSNHLGLSAAALQSCLRIMRIAVHPLLQGKGLGSEMLTALSQVAKGNVDYLATNFGATAELVRFWKTNEFLPVRIGSAKDKASGTYSSTFICPLSLESVEWIDEARNQFGDSLHFALRSHAQDVDPSLALSLLKSAEFISLSSISVSPLVANYARGGNSFNSARPFLVPLIPLALSLNGGHVSPLIVAVVIQEWSWTTIAEYFGFAGKKQAEQAFRQELFQLLTVLQCK